MKGTSSLLFILLLLGNFLVNSNVFTRFKANKVGDPSYIPENSILFKEINRASLSSSEDEDLGQFFTYFAAFGYCKIASIKNNLCCSGQLPNTIGETNSGGWTLIDYGESKQGKPTWKDEDNSYAVFRNDKYKKVVITFPGTNGFGQLIKEFLHSGLKKFTNEKHTDVYINEYFGTRAKELLPIILSPQNLPPMRLDLGYQIIFTGHSLGGAMGAAFAYMALDLGYITTKLNKPVIYTYGQPRSGNYQFKQALESETVFILRMINELDIVPMIPPCAFKELIGFKCKETEVKTYWHTEPAEVVDDYDKEGKVTYKDAEVYKEELYREIRKSFSLEELVSYYSAALSGDMDKVNALISQKVECIDKIIEWFKKRYRSHINYYGVDIGSQCEGK